jgi:hypothetical protein
MVAGSGLELDGLVGCGPRGRPGMSHCHQLWSCIQRDYQLAEIQAGDSRSSLNIGSLDTACQSLVDLYMAGNRSSMTLKEQVALYQERGRAMDMIAQRELEQLTDAEALAAAEDLLDLLRYLPPRDQPTSGLVEQQRLFKLLRD